MRICVLTVLLFACGASKDGSDLRDTSVLQTVNTGTGTTTHSDGTGSSGCYTCVSTTTTATTTTTTTTAIPGIELIADRHFERGFQAMDPVSGLVTGTLEPGFAAGAPVWQLGQWGSATSLGDLSPVVLPSGAQSWSDAYGGLTIGTTGTADADLSLHVNANAEYGGVYRTVDATVTWPHLLGEQRLSAPGQAGPGCPSLNTLDTLQFSLDAKLLYDNRNLGPGFDAGRHAGQYLIYFTVQNLGNPASAGYGDYLWFGVTVYDDRNPMPTLYVAGDDATGKLIYNIGLAPLTAQSLTDNTWHTLSEDLLPHVLLALDEAWNRGYLQDSTNLADYRIGGMNLGWEIPGLNDAELQIRDLSLTYTQPTTVPSGSLRYDFNTDGDREGWTSTNLTDANNGPVGGLWTLNAAAADPVLLGPSIAVAASSYSSVDISLSNGGGALDTSRMQVFWSLASSPGFSEAQSAWIDIRNDGVLDTYSIDLSAQPTWTGTVDQLRIDPITVGSGQDLAIDAVVLSP